MPLSFIKQQKQAEVPMTLLVDIGSSSVGVALVKIVRGSAPHIVASVREDISFQQVLQSHRFQIAMNRALDKALKSINSQGLASGGLLNVFCTLSSPWFILKTRNLDISRPEEFEVNEHNLDGFINEDIELLKSELKDTLPAQDIRIIEKKILQMKLNGYEIKNPYKQRTSRMDVLTTIGVSSNRVVQSVEKIIHGHFHVVPVHFGVFPIAEFSAIRDMFPTEKNFVFLDITGESTDASLVDADMLVKTVSFARGKNYFIREISSRLHTVHEEAATLFSMFLRDELDAARKSQVSEIITKAEAEWVTRFEKTLDNMTQNGSLPSKIFFTADTDVTPLFTRLVARAKLESYAGGVFDIQYLDQLIVSKFVSFAPEVTRDPFIVVEALLAEKLSTQPLK